MALRAKTGAALCAAVFAVGTLMVPSAPAVAAIPVAGTALVPQGSSPALAPEIEGPRTDSGVQLARGGRNWNGNRALKRRGGPRYYHHGPRRGYRGGVNPGAVAAAGVVGLAAGAIAGSALAAPQSAPIVIDTGGVPAPYTAEWYRQCDLKYRSFRASDGTFLGYDGVRKVCRLP